jgi:hypothetical protein
LIEIAMIVYQDNFGMKTFGVECVQIHCHSWSGRGRGNITTEKSLLKCFVHSGILITSDYDVAFPAMPKANKNSTQNQTI